MNEPFAGDFFKDPLIFLPGVAGARSLQPAYDTVAASIREIDTETIVMYEPVVYGMIHDSTETIGKLLSSGFSHVPGGVEYANKSAFSYHYYCWLAHPGDGTTYNRVEKAACDKLLGPAVFNAVEETTTRIGGGSMMTEFG